MSTSSQFTYEVNNISSTCKKATWSGYEAVWQAIGEGWVVLWQHHQVFTGVIEQKDVRWLNDEKPEPGDEHLVRLRAFNEIMEYHFWRSGSSIAGRLRTDEPGGEATEAVDTAMMLRSVVAAPLKAEKGTEDLYLLSRNYIDYHAKTGQAGYVDSRFLDFYTKGEVKKLH